MLLLLISIGDDYNWFGGGLFLQQRNDKGEVDMSTLAVEKQPLLVA
jgi:hypothetical protein